MSQRILRSALSLTIAMTAVFTTMTYADEAATAAEVTADADNTDAPVSILDFKVQQLDGEEVVLREKYQGKVVLIVNVASKCGLTRSNYTKLQALHEAHSETGLAILGFPCNQFGKQEPGTADDIRQFCTENYGVTFDMFSKVQVNGDETCDFYKALKSTEVPPVGTGDIKWNFEKFLISRDGKLVGRFSPRTAPDSEELMTVVKAELEKEAPPQEPTGEESVTEKPAVPKK